MILAPDRMDWRRDGRDWPNRALSRFPQAAGRRWHVQRGGTGPRILLLHGTGAATHSWRDVLPRLIARAEVLAPDLPGHGFSAMPSVYRLSLAAMAEDIGALCAAEDFRPDVIVGHSAGAAIALAMTLGGHARPGQIVGFGGALTPFRGAAGILFPAFARMLSMNPLTARVVARTASDRSSVRRLIAGTGSRIDARGVDLYARLIAHPAHIRAVLAMMARWELDGLSIALPALATPTLLVTGGADRAVPEEETRRLANAWPAAEHRHVPALGHLLHEEAPGMAAEIILEAARTATRPRLALAVAGA
ncbi:MAG: alpha/beta fold hydrolase BchO [Pseudomonadota bacterium]